MDRSNTPRRRHDEEDADEHMSWTNGPLWWDEYNSEPPDVERYVLSRLAPDPVTGTPYPITGKLESIWSGPTWIDIFMYCRVVEAIHKHVKCSEELPGHLHALWADPQNTMSKRRNVAIQHAVRRLRELPKLRESNTWGPDIIFKAFNDLDLVLFGGVLGGYCRLRWNTEKELAIIIPGDETIGMTHNKYISLKRVAIPGVDPVIKGCVGEAVTVRMNSTEIFLHPMEDGLGSRWESMWGTLLHEMVHAYMMRFLDPWTRFEAHGVDFQRCLRTVNRRLGKDGLNLGIEGVYTGKWEVDEEGNAIGEDIDDDVEVEGGEVEW